MDNDDNKIRGLKLLADTANSAVELKRLYQQLLDTLTKHDNMITEHKGNPPALELEEVRQWAHACLDNMMDVSGVAAKRVAEFRKEMDK